MKRTAENLAVVILIVMLGLAGSLAVVKVMQKHPQSPTEEK